jgi:hypothetical protein
MLYVKSTSVYTTCIPHSIALFKIEGQEVISTFKSYCLRNNVRKATATRDSDSCDGPGQIKLNAFWKGFNILDAAKNILDLWEVKISTLTGVWKKLIPTVTIDYEGFRILHKLS